jgi:hypothetical protein
LVEWLVGWLVEWLSGWLVGWLGKCKVALCCLLETKTRKKREQEQKQEYGKEQLTNNEKGDYFLYLNC